MILFLGLEGKSVQHMEVSSFGAPKIVMNPDEIEALESQSFTADDDDDDDDVTMMNDDGSDDDNLDEEEEEEAMEESEDEVLIESCFGPFPNKPWFFTCTSTNLLKTLWEKEKMLVTSNFSFFHSVFKPFGEVSAIFI